MVDSFTKWIEAFPKKTQEASEVAKIIFREIIARLGCPIILVSTGKVVSGGFLRFVSTLIR
jgi:deoxyhypusine synthase